MPEVNFIISFAINFGHFIINCLMIIINSLAEDFIYFRWVIVMVVIIIIKDYISFID